MAGILDNPVGNAPVLQMDAASGILGGMGQMRPGAAPLKGPIEAPSGYMYHATDEANLPEIAASGLKTHKPNEFTEQNSWPDGAMEKRNYFTPTAQNTWQFAPNWGNKPVLLRIPQNSHPFKQESTGDFYSRKIVAPENIEVMTGNGWTPISGFK